VHFVSDKEKYAKIAEMLEKSGLIAENMRVIICVSGGPDSMALLHFFWSIQKEKRIKLWAAHVNHMLRKEQADKDEKFVCSWCEEKKIEIRVKKEDIKQRAKEMKCGLEECGRKVRYAFFEELSKKLNAKIATAHTLSDNIETFLLNFLRGTGLNGLCGIPQVRGNIIRPFLSLSREDIEEYCHIYEIPFVIDDSNYSEDYTRNKIRNAVMPNLKKINPSLEKVFTRTVEQLKEDNIYLQKLANEAFEKAKTGKGFSRKTLLTFPKPILSRVLMLIAKSTFGINLETVHIKKLSLILKTGGCVTLPGENKLRISEEVLQIFSPLKRNYSMKIPFASSKILTEDGREVIIKKINNISFSNENNNTSYYGLLDASKIGKNVFFRNREPGDLFFHAGRNGTKTLKKFFNEKKVPIEVREKLLILADGKRVLWIENLGISELVKVDSKTREAYQLII
jgi:tRNA(Ile)-lysidine synthase